MTFKAGDVVRLNLPHSQFNNEVVTILQICKDDYYSRDDYAKVDMPKKYGLDLGYYFYLRDMTPCVSPSIEDVL